MSNYSGNEDHEVKDHKNDLKGENISVVDVCTPVEDSKEVLTQEDIKIKAQELKERAHKRREEEEKKREKEREKERIRVGKEMMEAKRIEEANERKRVLALRKAEKEEEKRAREKIRQKLEEDKAERRQKLGLDPEIHSSQKACAVPSIQVKKSFLPIRPATKLEQMRECLRSLKINNKDDDTGVKTAFQTLFTYVGNIFKGPDEGKFRKIRPTNTVFLERVGRFKEGMEFLKLCGFETVEEEGGEFLFMPRDKIDSTLLSSAGVELKSAIENPFFGLL